MNIKIGAGHTLLYKIQSIKMFLVASALLLSISLNSCSGNKADESANQQVQQLKQQVDSLSSDRNNMQSQFNAARVQVDQLQSAKASADSQIARKDAEIARLKRELNANGSKNRKLAAEIKNLKGQVASLNATVKSYLERIGILEKQNNDQAQEKNNWVSKYNSLKELGSVLHASNIHLEAIHLKHHGRKEKDTKRARKVDLLRIHFDIDENRIADNGTKQLYIVVKGPDGNMLNGTSAQTFKTASGGSMNYSILKEVSLIQGEPVKNLSADWKQDGDYKKGTYNVEIYNGGYKIGGGIVSLK